MELDTQEANQMLACQLKSEQKQEALVTPRLDRQCRVSRFQQLDSLERWKEKKNESSSGVFAMRSRTQRIKAECWRQIVPESAWLVGRHHQQSLDPGFLMAKLPC